jgi:hypothetical protein
MQLINLKILMHLSTTNASDLIPFDHSKNRHLRNITEIKLNFHQIDILCRKHLSGYVTPLVDNLMEEECWAFNDIPSMAILVPIYVTKESSSFL